MTNHTNSTPATLLLWHTYDVSHVLQKVASSEDGMIQDNAEQRFKEFGANRLRPVKKKGPIARFLVQFQNELIKVLMVSGVVTPLHGHSVESGVIYDEV